MEYKSDVALRIYSENKFFLKVKIYLYSISKKTKHTHWEVSAHNSSHNFETYFNSYFSKREIKGSYFLYLKNFSCFF